MYLAGRVIDLILCGLIVFAAYRMTIFDYNDINHLFYGLQLPDMVAGCSLIILLMGRLPSYCWMGNGTYCCVIFIL
ncbi:transporter [Aliivibrio fischeri MJ11]|uniref:Transporter n=1 Tax=Aliivibrio fischeri (strain MJ11) TaxID=388396 RepID=B5FDH3_ALIFM|nr:transporter [Aliivibrio fischeri MJ11]